LREPERLAIEVAGSRTREPARPCTGELESSKEPRLFVRGGKERSALCGIEEYRSTFLLDFIGGCFQRPACGIADVAELVCTVQGGNDLVTVAVDRARLCR
jgi:hypothetical protein